MPSSPSRPECPRRRRCFRATGAAAVLSLIVGLPAACSGEAPELEAASSAAIRPTVLRKLPHDATAFTQGLEVDGSAVIESTGKYGASDLRRWDLRTGVVEHRRRLPDDVFAEGVTRVGRRYLQLTWKERRVFVHRRSDLSMVRTLPFDDEGWGICATNRSTVFTSDGSSALTERDPVTLAPLRSVIARDASGNPIDRLNELECVGGVVWANVWQTDRIIAIDRSSGAVRAEVDASGLLDTEEAAGADVLNGIAHLGGNRFVITGKYWPAAFVVRLPEPW